jgi:hypothetical protein
MEATRSAQEQLSDAFAKVEEYIYTLTSGVSCWMWRTCNQALGV